jgi:hypothetical protein
MSLQNSFEPNVLCVSILFDVVDHMNNAVSRHVDIHGNKRVTGVPGALKQSQAYTRRFGIAIAKIYSQHKPLLMRASDELKCKIADFAPVQLSVNMQICFFGITNQDIGSHAV